MSTRHIALLGGAFDPPHLGHAALATWALSQNSPQGPVDEVWWVPSYQHPFGKKMASWEDRIEMLQLMFQEIAQPRFVLSEAEYHYALNPSYTILLIEQLIKEYPVNRWSWILGTDAAAHREKWHRIGDLIQMIHWIIAPRTDHPGGELPPWESRRIREAVGQGRDIKPMVGSAVAEYIWRRGLYTE